MNYEAPAYICTQIWKQGFEAVCAGRQQRLAIPELDDSGIHGTVQGSWMKMHDKDMHSGSMIWTYVEEQ